MWILRERTLRGFWRNFEGILRRFGEDLRGNFDDFEGILVEF